MLLTLFSAIFYKSPLSVSYTYHMRRCRADMLAHNTTQKFLAWFSAQKMNTDTIAESDNPYRQYWKRSSSEETAEPLLELDTLANDFGKHDRQKVIEIKIAARIYLHYVRNVPSNKKEEENFSHAKHILQTHEIDADSLLAAKEYANSI